MDGGGETIRGASAADPHVQKGHASPQESTGTARGSEMRETRAGRVRYEEDGGVRLAGGPADEDGELRDDDPTETGATVTLPPPYYWLGRA